MKSPVVKRSIVLGGHKTSVSLEDAFWNGLKEIAGRRLMTLSNFVESIDRSVSKAIFRRRSGSTCWSFIAAKFPPPEGREGLRELMDRPKPLLS